MKTVSSPVVLKQDVPPNPRINPSKPCMVMPPEGFHRVDRISSGTVREKGER